MFTVKEIEHIIQTLINEDEFITPFKNNNNWYIENRCDNTNIDIITKTALLLSKDIEYFDGENYEDTYIYYEYDGEPYAIIITKHYF